MMGRNVTNPSGWSFSVWLTRTHHQRRFGSHQRRLVHVMLDGVFERRKKCLLRR